MTRSPSKEAFTRLEQLFLRPEVDLRALSWLGLLLVLSGVGHAGVWLADGAPSLLGPVSWRKPIVFGLSSGVTTLSVGWMAGLLPATRWRARLSWIYAATMLLEIALIDAQRWRGVGSHFNLATPLDGAVFSLMGVLICVSVAAASAIGLRAARSPSVAPDDRVAAGAGVGLLLVGSLVGAVMSIAGTISGATGGGLMKLPHGIALHGLQLLPMLGWWLERRGLAAHRRAGWVKAAAAALVLLFGSTLLIAWRLS
ncbi:MAG: hypothetical protein MUF64_05915 [Polyangiaceae bacterium]|nr:hypothetical protein [Polyangiaceae bacterium]